ncbi:DNA-3-methyladenine glycosylase 2 family protein [Streptomyces sp. NPDC059900]|uniref:DNA-3-methyladenine glycosylase family protein n=1 Tax=Streptomyces sp. NPDC059900 TaxID=3155816 RepID=UPI00342CD967
MTTTHQAQLTVRGSYDLRQARRFLEAWPPGEPGPADDALQFTYCAPPDWTPTSVRITQPHPATLTLTSSAPVTPHLTDDVARILSVDVDGSPLDDIAARDPVIDALARSAPGLRPVCFWSPWEAACWAVLSQRTSRRAASAHKQRITQLLGPRVEFSDNKGNKHIGAAFPAPRTVAEATTLPGVNPVKLERIQAIARAADDGALDAATLRAMPTDDALARLRGLPGIGPFSAHLILIRAAGAPDVFPATEPRLLHHMRAAYALPEATPQQLTALSEAWKPLRSWASFLLRAVPQPGLSG